ncbi:hypothetical protein NKR19_g2784 [Coniochaeta hoffmannii]|uniref:Biotrophy-associated secreted protein 2 n=1 Tax=Coniochaeta hoffmannii TaxID=91930 RepID=A0AA38S4Y5_9PEZI|nr:hypothetical protein NKR19_g2784 [Coniochaeta hoffmannii]
MVRITLATVLAFAVTSLALVQPNNAGAKDVGNGQGNQFITGGCVNDADCGSACCANNSQGLGVCSAEAAALQNDKQGCGFVDPKSAQTIAAAKQQVAKQGF